MAEVIFKGPEPLGRGALLGEAIGDRIRTTYDDMRQRRQSAEAFNPVREALLKGLQGPNLNPGQQMLVGLAQNPEAFAEVMGDPNRMAALQGGAQVATPAADDPIAMLDMADKFKEAGDLQRYNLLTMRAFKAAGLNMDPQDVDRVIELLGAAGIDPSSEQGQQAILANIMGGRGGPSVTVNTGDNTDKATEAYGTGVGQAALDRDVMAQSAAQGMSALDRIEQALDAGAQTGRGQNWLLNVKSLANSLFGIELSDAASEQEVIRALQAKMMTDFRSTVNGGGLPGATSNRDLELMASAVPGLNQTEAGNRQLIKYLRAMYGLQVGVAREQQRLIAAANGRIPPDLNQRLQAFVENAQLLTEAERAALRRPTGNATSPTGAGGSVDSVVSEAQQYLNSLSGGAQ